MDNPPRLFSNQRLVFKTGAVFFSAIVMLMVFALSAACLNGFSGSPYFTYFVQVAMAVLVFLVPALLCAFLFHGQGESTLGYLSQNIKVSLPVFGMGVALMALGVVITTWLGELNKMLWPEDEAVVRHLVQLLTQGGTSFMVLRLIVMALVPAITEEMFFRGLLQNTFARYLHPGAAVAVSALIFALAHGDMSGVLPRFALGALLGYLLVRTGSLWLPIACHFLNNAFVVVGYHFFFNNETQTCLLDDFVARNLPLLLASAAAFVAALWQFNKRTEA